MSKSSIAPSDNAATARCGVQTERRTQIETMKKSSVSDQIGPKKIMRRAMPKSEAGQEWNTGTWTVRFETVRGRDCMGSAFNKGRREPYLVWKSRCRSGKSEIANHMRRASAGRCTGQTTQIWFGLGRPVDSLIRRSKSDAQVRDRLSRCGEKNTFAHALGLSLHTVLSYDENRAPINNSCLGHPHVSPQPRRHFLEL